MRRSKLKFAYRRILFLSVLCSVVLSAGEKASKETLADTVVQHKEVFQLVPSFFNQTLSDAVMPRTTESAPPGAHTARQQNAIAFDFLQEFSSWVGAVDLVALVGSAGYSLVATVLLLGFIRWRWMQQTRVVLAETTTQRVEAHGDQKHTVPKTMLDGLLNAASLSVGMRGTLRPRESEAVVFARKIRAHEASQTPASLHSLLRDRGADDPINLARRTNRSRGEVELALHLQAFQRSTTVIGGTV
jgi:hypothetical protein